jgi:hypothetical protein
MPLLEDLSVYEDGDVFTVYDHSYEDEDAEPGRGRWLGTITKGADGHYVPDGPAAIFPWVSPAETIDDALAAFVG